MKQRFNLISIIATIGLFILPTLFYPVRGGIGDDYISFRYGFPFNWITFKFNSQSGRLMFFDALARHDAGFEMDIITGLLNLLVLFIIIRAILVVFFSKREEYKRRKSKKLEEKDGK